MTNILGALLSAAEKPLKLIGILIYVLPVRRVYSSVKFLFRYCISIDMCFLMINVIFLSILSKQIGGIHAFKLYKINLLHDLHARFLLVCYRKKNH